MYASTLMLRSSFIYKLDKSHAVKFNTLRLHKYTVQSWGGDTFSYNKGQGLRVRWILSRNLNNLECQCCESLTPRVAYQFYKTIDFLMTRKSTWIFCHSNIASCVRQYGFNWHIHDFNIFCNFQKMYWSLSYSFSNVNRSLRMCGNCVLRKTKTWME